MKMNGSKMIFIKFWIVLLSACFELQYFEAYVTTMKCLDRIRKNLHFTSFLMQFSDSKLHFQLRRYVDSLCCSWRGTPCSFFYILRSRPHGFIGLEFGLKGAELMKHEVINMMGSLSLLCYVHRPIVKVLVTIFC